MEKLIKGNDMSQKSRRHEDRLKHVYSYLLWYGRSRVRTCKDANVSQCDVHGHAVPTHLPSGYPPTGPVERGAEGEQSSGNGSPEVRPGHPPTGTENTTSKHTVVTSHKCVFYLSVSWMATELSGPEPGLQATST
jgi:hypothetical protein